MSDAIHLLSHRIKEAWRRHKVTVMLCLDGKGAFPNVVTHQLLHNMRSCRMPESYMTFIECMLTGQHTSLKFDGYMSEWASIDNGIVQGDPLSMILYLFYNADLLENAGKLEVKVRYVDDINFYVEGSTFKDAYTRIWDMMTRANSGKDWSMNHNSRYELSKLKLVGFSRH